MKKFTTLALTSALTAAMACTAFAADSKDVAVAADGSFVLTVDTTGVFTTDEDEYARGWLQTYGAAINVTKVTLVSNGAEVDVTEFAVIDGSDNNYTVYITPEYDKDDTVKIAGYTEDRAVLEGITAINYYVTKAGTGAEDEWYGGAIGSNDANKGWNSVGQWSSSEDDRGSKEFILVAGATDPEPSNPTGDTTPVVYLAAVVALAGVALVASKKARA